jgi:hypothetical protein
VNSQGAIEVTTGPYPARDHAASALLSAARAIKLTTTSGLERKIE